MTAKDHLVVGVLALFVAQPLAAQYEKLFATVDSYVAAATGVATVAVVGPPNISVVREVDGAKSPPELTPSTKLTEILSGCNKTNGSYSHGFGGAPKKVVGRYYFECVGAKVWDRSVALEVTSSPDGASVEKVGVLLGGPIYKPSPPPMLRPERG